jgi:hypothetical protein
VIQLVMTVVWHARTTYGYIRLFTGGCRCTIADTTAAAAAAAALPPPPPSTRWSDDQSAAARS